MKLTLKIDETIVISTNVSNPDSCGMCTRQAVDVMNSPICQLFPGTLDKDHDYGFLIRSDECKAHEVGRTLPTPPKLDYYKSINKDIIY